MLVQQARAARVRGEQRLGLAGSSGESVAVTPVSWKTNTGGQERTEVAVKSMGCVSRVSDNGNGISEFNHSESEIQPLYQVNVACWRGSPLSSCQPPQAMLNPFLLASDFAALPAVHFILITPGSPHLRIPKQQQPPCYFFTAHSSWCSWERPVFHSRCPLRRRIELIFLCFSLFLRKDTAAALAQIPSLSWIPCCYSNSSDMIGKTSCLLWALKAYKY